MKDVVINIKSTQGLDEDSDSIELTTEGKFGIKNGEYYISYNDSEMCGLGNVKTNFFIKFDNSVVLYRTGEIESRLEIVEGKRTVCCYRIPEGELSIGVLGESIEVNLTPSGGTVKLRYSIDSDLRLISQNEVSISVREVK